MAVYRTVLCISVLSAVAFSANIFVSSPFGGSHLHSIYSIAIVLADAGHNVTFINLEEGALDSYNHPAIHGYTVKHNAWKRGESKKEVSEKCISQLISEPSSEARNALLRKGCIAVWRNAFEKSTYAYGGEEIQDLFKSTKFDVIVAETSDVAILSIVGKYYDIPVVHYTPSLFIFTSILHTNLPMLSVSQPTPMLITDLNRTPTFLERLDALLFVSKLSTTGFFSNSQTVASSALGKFGFTSMDEVSDSVKLFLTNDHVALSFPFLRPPNDIAIGAISLLDTADKPADLSDKIIEFINNAADKPLVYVSFGSYVDVDGTPWFKTLIETLEMLDTRAIVKVGKNTVFKFSDKVLPLAWAPQVDLLKSGKVKLFISHCGNNGRIETIFFNVPVICVPLFADQGVNSELVKFKRFGEVLFKEDVKVHGEEVISDMIKNHEFYYKNMKRASDIIKEEPGNVKEKLLFYIDQLAKYKNLDYLENKIIKQQNIIEIYNLDIVIPSGLIFLAVVIIIFYTLFRCCKCTFSLIFGKFAPKVKKQ